MKTEKVYRITWTIDQNAKNPLEAIMKAIEAMPVNEHEDTLATVFDVAEVDENGKEIKGTQTQIDILDELDEFQKELEDEDLNKTMDKCRNENY